jgi:sugar lactone lactonase YvrE
MSIAHVNIVSPLASQYVPYRRSDPANGQGAKPRLSGVDLVNLGSRRLRDLPIPVQARAGPVGDGAAILPTSVTTYPIRPFGRRVHRILSGQTSPGVLVRKLFVSYARQNRADVDALVQHLGMMGYDTWVDVSLRGGQDWWEEILRRIADSDVFIAIISRASLNSTACSRECDWAEALGKPVLPVAVEPPPTALPRRFSRRQIIDYSEPSERAVAALLLQGGLGTLPAAPPLPDPLPEPPSAPLSYLTDLIELVSQPASLDQRQQHDILNQLEPALRSTDPEEQKGGRDILEKLSSRRDLYADVDRMVAVLKGLYAQPATVVRDTEATPSTTVTKPVEHVIRATTASPVSTPETGFAEADTSETTEETPIAGSDTDAVAHAVDKPAPGLKPLFQRLSRRTKIISAIAAALIIVVVAVIAIVASQASSRSGSPQTSGQIELPFTDLNQPSGVAVDSAGNVYVADSHNNRVLKLAAGATAPTELAFAGLSFPTGVAVDTAGTVYVADNGNNRVLKLAAGETAPTVLPFSGLDKPWGVAVDSAGNVYVTDTSNNRVLKLAAGASAPAELPFTGLDSPDGVAVDTAGSLYVADTSNNRLLKLAAGASAPTVPPFTGVNNPWGVAVDRAGNVYVTEGNNNRVLKLAAGGGAPIVLPFTDLNNPLGVAVDTAGNVYVANFDSRRVLKLPAR